VIISYSKKFIFLHSRKTAGSSLAVLLANHLQEEDIMVGCWDNAYKHGVPYNKKTVNVAKKQVAHYLVYCLKNKLKGRQFCLNSKQIDGLVKRHYKNKYGLLGAHSSASCVKIFCPDLWHRAFKFAFVRNPWDHAVSDYYWRRQISKKSGISFKEFLFLLDQPMKADPKKMRPSIITNWSVYTIDDQITVDYVGRYEDLQSEVDKISKYIGLETTDLLIKAKGNFRDRSKSLASHYDEESIELVRKIYQKEIDEFNYNVPF
jgi:hypothetical protein